MASLETRPRELASAKDKQQGYATVASLLSQMDDKPAALRVMRQFRDRNPRSKPSRNTIIAMLAAAADEREQALISLNLKHWTRNPKLVSAHLLRTRILLDQGERDAALAGLAKAVAALPRDRSLRMDYARLLVDAGQLDKARREFATLLNQNPKDTDSLIRPRPAGGGNPSVRPGRELFSGSDQAQHPFGRCLFRTGPDRGTARAITARPTNGTHGSLATTATSPPRCGWAWS
jgi:tetratricopeptide (TPR) repeat protein